MPQASPSALPPACSSVVMWVTCEMTKHNGHSARCRATCEPAEEAHLPGHKVLHRQQTQNILSLQRTLDMYSHRGFFNTCAHGKETQRSVSSVLCKRFTWWQDRCRSRTVESSAIYHFCSILNILCLLITELLCGRLHSQVYIYTSLCL